MTPFTRYLGGHCRVTGSRIRYFARDGELCPHCAKRNAKDENVKSWDWNAPVGVALEADIPGVPRDCIDTCTNEETS